MGADKTAATSRDLAPTGPESALVPAIAFIIGRGGDGISLLSALATV
jgi:hypothetical protein